LYRPAYGGGVNGGMLDRQAFVAARKAKGFSQSHLARVAGVSQQLIGAIETGATRTTKYLPRIAVALEVEPGHLDSEWARVPAPARDPEPIPRAALMGARDFPIHASVEGGAGQIIVSTDPVDFMPRPAPVAQVKGAYGVYVVGESMVPEYRPGDVALVDPYLPVIANEVYIFYGERDGESRATIKHLRRVVAEAWQVRQWNPPDGMKSDFALPRRDWPKAHRVIGKYTRR
jgi:phage repressor protein C with HTH and peptisase S24 domain